MEEGCKLLKKWIVREGFTCSSEEATALFEFLKLKYDPDNKGYIVTYKHLSELLKEQYPGRVLYYQAYLTNRLSEIIVYLIVERLIKKKLSAEFRQVWGLCFSAEKLLENEIVENYTHAANYIIKIYEQGDWFENCDFLDVFEEYQEPFKLDSLDLK